MSVKFKVVNVVATAALDRSVDLELLAKDFRKEVLFDSDIYGGRVAYFKSKDMTGKVSIFWSGKMIGVGTRTINGAKRELELVAKVLRSNLKTKPSIRNIVAIVDFGVELDLNSIASSRIASSRKFRIIYEPEQFPGVIVHVLFPHGKKAVFLIFGSGKVVCTGPQSILDLEDAVRTLSADIVEIGETR